MRRLLVFALFVLFVSAPFAAGAQVATSPAPSLQAQAAATPPATFLGMTPGQAVTVGVGIAVGAVGVNTLVGGGAGGVLVGALAGALIGSWWYDAYGPTLKPLTDGVAPSR